MTTYHLDDSTIAALMQLLQLSMLTLTPIDDLLRHIELEVNDKQLLVMTPENVTNVESFCSGLLDQLEGMADFPPGGLMDEMDDISGDYMTSGDHDKSKLKN